MSRNEYFMGQALELAEQGLSIGEFPVGCVIVHQNTVVATGRRTNSRTDINELDHAELVAFRKLLQTGGKIDPGEVTIYSTMEPCLMCFSSLLVNGVQRYVYSYEDVMGGGTNLPLEMLAPLYSQMQISITKGVLRERSLELFRDFFMSPNCKYLKGTLLATYTLKQ